MIPRYTHPEMGAIWSDAAPLRDLARGRAGRHRRAGRGRRRAGRRRARRCANARAFDIARIDEIEQTTQHDVIAFTTAVAERVGPAARWLHFGLTSSDVLDTALALQMRAGLRPDPAGHRRAARRRSRARADEHRRTPMIGRTHGVHAEPMTFGVKLALWYAELAARSRRGCVRARETVVGRQDLGRGRHVRAPRSGDRGGGLRAARPRSRRRCRRRSSSATGTRS